jgi:actin-related protein 6
MAASPVLVIDNGAYETKIGYAGHEKTAFRLSNCITRSKDRRTYIGDDINSCKDYAGLTYRRPHERGQLVSWDCQRAIWDSVLFGRGVSNISSKPVAPDETSLILTEMPFSLPALSSNMDQVVFEEYGFKSYYRCTPGSLVPWNDIRGLYGDVGTNPDMPSPVSECTLVIDSGFSATHVLPVVLGEVYWPAVRRLNIGGKHLTNYLKETVSFRYYNMMEETFLTNVIKERTCFVSQNFKADLEECYNNNKSKYRLSYVLPDFKTSRLGHIMKNPSEEKDHQVLSLANERFTIPEPLFYPSDLNIDQMGIPETAMSAVNAMPAEFQSMLLANVVLVGGNAKIPGYKARLENELRALVPQDHLLRVGLPDDPITYAWQGGSNLGCRWDMLSKAYVTRDDYLEHGVNLCLSRFGIKKMDITETSG